MRLQSPFELVDGLFFHAQHDCPKSLKDDGCELAAKILKVFVIPNKSIEIFYRRVFF
jgi:hypothetical protein